MTNELPDARIYFSGGAGCGKSTLTKAVSAAFGLPVIPSASRCAMSALGMTAAAVRQKGRPSFDFQVRAAANQSRWEAEYLAKHGGFVTDRTGADQLVYGALQSGYGEELARRFEAQFRHALLHPKAVVFLVEPNHDAVTNAIAQRVKQGQTDLLAWLDWKEVQTTFDLMKLMLDKWGIQYYTVKPGKPETQAMNVVAAIRNIFGTKSPVAAIPIPEPSGIVPGYSPMPTPGPVDLPDLTAADMRADRQRVAEKAARVAAIRGISVAEAARLTEDQLDRQIAHVDGTSQSIAHGERITAKIKQVAKLYSMSWADLAKKTEGQLDAYLAEAPPPFAEPADAKTTDPEKPKPRPFQTAQMEAVKAVIRTALGVNPSTASIIATMAEAGMGLLNDGQIRRTFLPTPSPDGKCGPVRMKPFDLGTKRAGYISSGLSSAGYDFSLGDTFRLFSNANCSIIDPLDFDEKALVPLDLHEEHRTTKEGVSFVARYVIMPPHSYLLAETVEWLDIPPDILIVLLGKSTYARSGIIVNCTPLEPGWRGRVTLEIANVTPIPAKLYAGMGIAQGLFFRTTAPAEKPYGERSGRYQDQTGLTPPKSHNG